MSSTPAAAAPAKHRLTACAGAVAAVRQKGATLERT
jgi:hypothetical protein